LAKTLRVAGTPRSRGEETGLLNQAPPRQL